MTKRQKLTSNAKVWPYTLLAIAAIGGIAANSTGLGVGDALPPSKPRALPVEVRRVQHVDQIVMPREFTGNIRAARTSELSFEMPGRLLSMAVDEGAVVSPGQVLANIDVESVAARRASVSAQVDQAQALLAELVKGPRRETIAAARAELAKREAELNSFRLDYERSSKLLAKDSISQERYDSIHFQFKAADAARESAQQALDELVAGTRPERLTAQRAVVKQLEAEVRSLQLDVEDGTLRAPFAGVISKRLVDEGTVVAAGKPVLVLVENAKLEAWIGMPPESARQLTLGETRQLHAGTRGFHATVTSLRPELNDVTRTQNVILDLNQSAGVELVPGQIVRLPIDEVVPVTGYLLPASCLAPGPRGLWNVQVLGQIDDSNAGVVQTKSVELLYSLGDQSLVRGTLNDGDAVIIDGVHRVVAGQTATAVNSGQGG